MAKFRKGVSGNPGGPPKFFGDLQELARMHAPTAIVELGRLALKAKSETARIAAIRELLDRGYGRARQSVEVYSPGIDPIKMLLEEMDAELHDCSDCFRRSVCRVGLTPTGKRRLSTAHTPQRT
jgi:hypothetical protein